MEVIHAGSVFPQMFRQWYQKRYGPKIGVSTCTGLDGYTLNLVISPVCHRTRGFFSQPLFLRCNPLRVPAETQVQQPLKTSLRTMLCLSFNISGRNETAARKQRRMNFSTRSSRLNVDTHVRVENIWTVTAVVYGPPKQKGGEYPVGE